MNRKDNIAPSAAQPVSTEVETLIKALESEPEHFWLARIAKEQMNSGIPPCCAIFGIIYNHGGDSVHIDPREEYDDFAGELGVALCSQDYAPCPRCVLEGTVIAVPCEDCDDGDNEGHSSGQDEGNGIASKE